MPHQTEPSANNALGNLLQGMLGKAMVRSENTQVIEGHAGLQPDILVTAGGRSPVVIEAEYDPAQNVEPEATQRLGLNVNGQVRPIEAAIALRYPEAVGDAVFPRQESRPAWRFYNSFSHGALCIPAFAGMTDMRVSHRFNAVESPVVRNLCIDG